MADMLLTRKTTISAFYRAWVNMKTRCTNKNSRDYHRYGARGITVCPEWLDFDGFVEDMYGSYKPGLTLDRIDNSKGYSKENCRWATRKEQAQNTRNVDRALRYSYNGVTRTIKEWAEEYGLKRQTLHMRLTTYDWPIEKALTRKIG